MNSILTRQIQMVHCAHNNNFTSSIKLFNDNLNNEYLNYLESETILKYNVTRPSRFNKLSNNTTIKYRRRPSKKLSYIESLIIPIFLEEDNNNDDEIDDEHTVPIGNRRIQRKNSYQKSSSDGLFTIEEVDANFNFSSIGGYHEVKNELIQVLDFLINSDNYTKYNVRIPKGLLLEGPPGNGKTLLAKALAGESASSFISTSGAIFNEKYIGVGSARIRELFKLAESNLPCIIFIDELDAVAKKRHASGEGADSERDQTLNQLLVAMDGYQKNGPLLVVGATNRIDILDKAIIRPGRFDKIINVPNPDAITRDEIIKIHSTGKPINVNNTELVKMTSGMSGAQLENLINEAVLYSIRNNELPVNMTTFNKIKDKILFGQSVKKKDLSVNAQKRIAIHECGHLLMALTSKHVEKPEKMSIDTMSNTALGYTMFETSDIDEGLYIREYLEDKLKVLLGGRVAEEVIYGHSVSSGALSDLEQAFNMAKTMILNYGFGTKIIYPHFSEEFKQQIDNDIHMVINIAYKETKKTLDASKGLLLKLSEELYDKKVLSFDEICRVITNTTITQ